MIRVVAEYIWIGGKGEFRSKARTLYLNHNYTIKYLPNWNYDGSSTGQATTEKSEIILKPRYICKCPFRSHNSILVMCDCYDINDKPIETNTRYDANNIFNLKLNNKPWYGIEQEYFIINKLTNKPFGYPEDGKENQGKYYCSIGSDNVFCRNIVEKHYNYCLQAGLLISGVNSEVAPGQWEYQIGPVEGILAADQHNISRYILIKLSEEFDVRIDFNPKPLEGKWNGSGCHVNFSTESTRKGFEELTGLDVIHSYIDKLSLKHNEHMNNYGVGNKLRMTGLNETSCFDKFSWGAGSRSSSVRIPTETNKNKNGYFEDRRPSSNMDPYIVTSLIFKTCCL